MNLLTQLKWDCIQPGDGTGLRLVRVNDELIDKTEVIATSRSGINVFDLFGEILDGADLKQFLTDHNVDVKDYKEPGALILRAFLLLVDLNNISSKQEDEEQQITLIDPTGQNHDDDHFQAVEIKEEPGFFMVQIEDEEKPRKRRKPADSWTCRVGSCREEEPKFETREAYLQHKKETAHFQCKACSVAFHTARELHQHMDQPDCRAFTCTHCGENFQTDDPKKKNSRNKKLQSHINLCTGHRPYVCDICGADFHLKDKLLKHSRTHTEEARQKREISRLDNLIRSEQRRINPRIFKCDQCDQAYTTNQRLKFHKIRTHQNITFPCPHCTLQLATPATLRNHIRSIHEGSDMAAVWARKSRLKKKAKKELLAIENKQQQQQQETLQIENTA